MPSIPTHYRPVDEDSDDPPPPYTPEASDNSGHTTLVASQPYLAPLSQQPQYPVMDNSNSSYYPIYQGTQANAAMSFTPPMTMTSGISRRSTIGAASAGTTAATAYPVMSPAPPPPPPTGFISSTMVSQYMPAAPMIPYPTMTSTVGQVPPSHGARPVSVLHPAGLSIPGLAPGGGTSIPWVQSGVPLMHPPPPPQPPAPVPGQQPANVAQLSNQAVNTPAALFDMPLITSPALASPSFSSSSSSSSSVVAVVPTLSTVEMPSLVTVYKCRKCGATLPSQDAVCTRLHANGWGAEKIQQATSADAMYDENRLMRRATTSVMSTDRGGASGQSLLSSSSSSSSSSTTAPSSSTTPLLSQQSSGEAGKGNSSSTSASHNNDRSSTHLSSTNVSSNYPNEKSGMPGYGHDRTSVYAAPSMQPHDPAAIYDLREMSPGSSSYLGRSRSVQHPIVSAKKFWRDFKKEVQQQGGELMGRGDEYQRQQHRIIVSPEGTTFVPGVGDPATMGRSYPLPPGAASTTGESSAMGATGSLPSGPNSGLQRHSTVHYTPFTPPYPHAGGPQATPSAPTQYQPFPPPHSHP